MTRAQCDLLEKGLCKTNLHNTDGLLDVVNFVASYQRITGHMPKLRG